MRKITLIIAVIMSLAATDLRGQEFSRRKGAWMDLQFVQNIGLNQWSSVGYVNDGLPRAMSSDVRGTLNVLFDNPYFGFYVDMAIAVMPAPRMKELDFGRMPVFNSSSRYFLREISSESGISGASAHLKMGIGLFGKIELDRKFTVLPYAGFGFMTMPAREYVAVAKEDGTNMQYDVAYRWLKEYESDTSTTPGYFNLRLNAAYRVSARLNLLFGLEYTYFMDTLDFYGSSVNQYNANVRREFNVEGNNMNMLGLSFGISFL